MRITRWGEYGILCCIYLAESAASEPTGAAEIAESRGIPLQYAQQILHRLRKGGIITSVRGPHGGFKLSRQPEKISLREILLAAEGKTFELICETDPIDHEACNAAADCGLRIVWQDLQSAINELLESRTLASILQQQLPGNGLVPGPRSHKDKPAPEQSTETSTAEESH